MKKNVLNILMYILIDLMFNFVVIIKNSGQKAVQNGNLYVNKNVFLHLPHIKTELLLVNHLVLNVCISKSSKNVLLFENEIKTNFSLYT